MTGLKLLNVSHNKIQNIPKNTFPKLYELHTIDMASNEITTISNGVFQTLVSLRNLNLSNNWISEINSTTFGTLPTILDINLDKNRITRVGRGALTKLNSLRTISLENNGLTHVIDIPISLNYLNLRNNCIKGISPKAWPIMNALLQVDLSENSLEDGLSKGSFEGLASLRYLNLSKNNISRIPTEGFLGLSTLQKLFLNVST